MTNEDSLASFAALVCKNCSRRMWLPEAKRPDTSQDQPSWPMDGHSRNFACPSCKHVHEYKAEDVRQIPLDETAQGLARKYRSVVRIEVSCGREGCAVLLKIHTLSAPDAEPSGVAREVLRGAFAHKVFCEERHELNGEIWTERPTRGMKGGSQRAQFDPDWK